MSDQEQKPADDAPSDTAATAESSANKAGMFARIKRPFIVLVALLLLLVGGGYLAARFGVVEFTIVNAVDRWIEEQEYQARADGTEVDVSYSELKLEGGLSDRYVVVKNPDIRIAPKGVSLKEAGDQVTRFATERMIIYPENSRLENMRIELPDAITLYDRGAVIPTFMVEPKTPIIVALGRETEQGQAFRTISHYLPVSWEIVSSQLVDENDEPLPEPIKHRYQLQLDEGGRYVSRTAGDLGLGEAVFSLKNAVLSDAQGAVIFKLKGIDSGWKGVVDPSEGRLQSFDVNIAELTLLSDSELLAYSPISFVAKLGINEAEESSIIIEQLHAKIADSRLQIKGGFELDQQEPVPFGNMVVQLDNIGVLTQNLLRDDVIGEAEANLVQQVANAVMGQEADLSSDLNFVVSREKGGSFSVGKVSVEQLLGTVLRSALQGVKITTDPDAEDAKRIEQLKKLRQQQGE